jgi:gluconolactonase
MRTLFSLDYSKLYITDTGASHKPGHPRQILTYDVNDNVQRFGGKREIAYSSLQANPFTLSI